MSQQDVEVTDAGEVLDGAEDGQDANADASTPLSDLEFAEALVCCELELIAAGDDPVRISLQMAVMRTARDALRMCAAIDALPEALSRPAWTRPTPSGLP